MPELEQLILIWIAVFAGVIVARRTRLTAFWLNISVPTTINWWKRRYGVPPAANDV